MRIRSTVGGVLTLLFAASAAASQEATPHTFHLIVGADTIASDVVKRTAEGVRVDLIALSAGLRTELTMTLADDQRVTAATHRNFPLGSRDTVPIYALVMEFAGDSVRGELTRPGRGTQRTVLPSREGAVLYLEGSSGTVEQVLRRAREIGGEEVTVPVLDLTTARTSPAVVRWVGGDAAVVTYGDLEVHATVAADGSLLRYSVPALGARAVRSEGAHPLSTR